MTLYRNHTVVMQEIENYHDNEANLKFASEDFVVELSVLLFCILVSCEKIVQYEDVCDIVLEAHPEYPNYQLEKVVVVLFSNAIIQVAAVVIESRCASVALATVFGTTKDV